MTGLPKKYNGMKHLPLPAGPFVVGCTDLMVGPDVSTGCFLRLFFPCEHRDAYEASSRWAPWIPHPKYIEGYTTVMGMNSFIGHKFIGWAVGNFWVPAIVDAKPLKEEEEQKYPVIIFSHGLTGCRTAYSLVCSELASHGFIVAALEHRDGSACMSYHLAKGSNHQDYMEEWVQYQPANFEKDDFDLRQSQLKTRVRECRRTLDLLMELNEGKAGEHILRPTIDLNHFKGLMDFTNPIMAGHSFGSATVLRTLAVEKRLKIGVCLDAWMWPLKDDKELPKDIQQPLLFINMEAFQTPKNLKAMKRFTEGVDHTERRVVTLKGSVHKNQVDLPFMVPPYLRRWVGLHSTIDPELAMDLNNRLVLLYLRKHLGHSADEEHLKFVEKHKEDFIYEGIP